MQTKSRSTKTRKLRSLWFDSFWDWLGEQFSVAPLWVMLMNSGTHGSLVCWDLLTSTSSHRFSRLVLGFCQWIPAIDRSLWCVRKKKKKKWYEEIGFSWMSHWRGEKKHTIPSTLYLTLRLAHISVLSFTSHDASLTQGHWSRGSDIELCCSESLVHYILWTI